jgi:hypothetical protein
MLLGARVEGDRLTLNDAVLTAALDGSRPLTAGERAALQASPLTLRRFKGLADMRRRAAAPAWSGSHGLLRAADSAGEFAALQTDDGMWRLHVVDSGGKLAVILQLDPQAPGAARVLADRMSITVRDGAKAVVLQGTLDADGECEGPWPFAATPAAHFQQHGAGFDVMPSA